MHHQNRTASPNGQRSAFPSFPKLTYINLWHPPGHVYDGELLALVKYEYLKQVRKRHKKVWITWFDHDARRFQRRYIGGRGVGVPGLWEFVRWFPHVTLSIWFQVDDDPTEWPIRYDDFTPQQELIAFLDAYDAHDWRNVVRRYAPTLRSYVTARVAKGKRSDVIYKIGATLRDRGASAGEVRCVLRASQCWRDKHGDNERALEAEVARIMAKRKT